jgi:hypothetical protein
MCGRRIIRCLRWRGHRWAPELGDARAQVVGAGGMAGRRRHRWLPAVKKKAASGGPGSAEQGSAWLVVGASIDGGSGTQLGYTSATACQCQRW